MGDVWSKYHPNDTLPSHRTSGGGGGSGWSELPKTGTIDQDAAPHFFGTTGGGCMWGGRGGARQPTNVSPPFARLH